PASAPRKESSAVAQHRAGEGVKTAHRQDTQTRSRLFIGQNGPSDSALAAARGWRLRRPAADRHAARCASRDLCSGGAPRRYTPSAETNALENGADIAKVQEWMGHAHISTTATISPRNASRSGYAIKHKLGKGLLVPSMV